MRYIFSIVGLLLLFEACQPEEEQLTTDPTAQLRFSSDTIFFDTLFTSLGSITKRFRVYNDSENAVNISSVSLGTGSNSPFSIFVNGVGGPTVNNVRILGRDSILLLAEVTIDPQNEDLPFLVTDEIIFLTNGNQQQVDLVAVGQDDNCLSELVLVCNTTWTQDRPYVIFNSVLVQENCTLNIEPGTKVYNHNGSFIFIGGTLHARGEADQKIIFANDRFDEDFIDAPGQWGGLIFLQNSRNHRIDHAEIRNANIGIYLGTPDDDDEPDLELSNTRIENIGGNSIIPSIDSLVQPGFGILAISSDLYAYNVLINNCEINLLANVAGGNYRYEHCTFANFSFNFFRRDPSVAFSNNLILGDGSLLVGNTTISMTNSILWGSLSEELLVSDAEEASLTIELNNNILQTQLPQFQNDNFFDDPRFFSPSEYDYRLDTLSPAKDIGLPLKITVAYNGMLSDVLPDLGAFERIE